MIHDMIMAAAGATGPVEPTDADFENTVLLLHGDGTNGAQNNTFIDSSTNNFTITRNGNTTQGTFSPFSKPDGRWGNFFDGTGDYLSVAYNSALSITSGDFCVETWLYRTTSGVEQYLCSQRTGAPSNSGWEWRINATNLCQFFFVGGSSITSVSTIPVNSWTHLAVTRDSNTVRLFINGALDTSETFSNGTASTVNPFIGNGTTGGGLFTGYISNLRLVKGSAVYTSAFTPSTTPLTAITNTSLLTCQSNRFIDNSSNNFAITRNGDVKVTPFSPFPITTAYSTSVNGGAGYFDAGGGDYLSVADDAALQLGTEFTIEFWLYDPDVPTSSYPFVTKGSTGGIDFLKRSSAGGSTIALFSGSSGSLVLEGGAVKQGEWQHLALTRDSSNNVRIFQNGAIIAGPTTYSSSVAASGAALTIANGLTNGFVSDLRILKGTALYTSAFTPPTAPLTTITNTSLLCNFTNAGIFDNTGFNALETVGNAQIDTTTKKYGTGSMEFDGTGDWLIVPDSPDLKLGTGNFTIEFWVYLATGDIGSNRGLVAKGGASTGFLVSLNTTEKVVFTFTTSTITSSGAITTNAWNHIAVVREGTGSNQTKIYINGTNDGTGTVSTDFTQTEIMYIGANRTAGDPMKGFIDDLRITKGIARYTTTFTPPTAALPDLGA
jgi:hypothetical protein